MSLFNIIALLTLMVLMLCFNFLIKHYCNIRTNFLALKRVTDVTNTNSSSLVVVDDYLHTDKEFLQTGNNINLYVKYAQIYCHRIELTKFINNEHAHQLSPP